MTSIDKSEASSMSLLLVLFDILLVRVNWCAKFDLADVCAAKYLDYKLFVVPVMILSAKWMLCGLKPLFQGEPLEKADII
jgi:hypothetical protein